LKPTDPAIKEKKSPQTNENSPLFNVMNFLGVLIISLVGTIFYKLTK